MKRLLAFLLLFASGVALLMWLDRPRTSEEDPDPADVEAPAEPEEPVPPEPVVPVPVTADPPPAEPAGQAAPFNLEGRVELRYREDLVGESPVLYYLVAEDSKTSELDPTKVELFDVRVLFYDPEHSKEEPSALLVAESALGTLAQTSGRRFDFALEPTLMLSGVTVTDYVDAPVVPMVVTAAEVEVHLENRTVRTVVPTRAAGPGLETEGTGLDVSLDGGRYLIAGPAFSSVQREDGSTATLTSNGPLTVERTDSSNEFVIVAEDSARLEVTEATSPGEVKSVTAYILTFLAAAEEGSARPRRATGTGEVVFDLPGADLFSERAELLFDDAGELSFATLSGLPSGVVDLELWVGNVPRDRESELYLSGIGPLQLDLSDARIKLDGPASAELGQTSLDAQEMFDVQLPRDGGPARMRAAGDVRFRDPPYLLETPDLLLTRLEAAGPDLPAALVADASGETHVEGVDDSGDPFTVDAKRELRVRVSGQDWRVEHAADVDFSLSGEDALSGHAGEICDLDPETQSFAASGGVDLAQNESELEGVELVALSSDVWLLWGEPAVLRGRAGTGIADRVDRLGDRVVARGNVDAELHQGGLELEVSSQLLEVEELAPTADGRYETSLLASGDVDVTYLAGEERAHVRGDLVDGLFHAVDGPDSAGDPLQREWTDGQINSYGNSFAEITQEDGRYEIRSDEFTTNIDRRPTPEDEPDALVSEEFTGEFTADGDVRLIGTNTLLTRARGGHLVVNHIGEGELLAAEDGRAHAAGLFSDGVRKFDLNAARIAFAPDLLEAWDPIGRFWEIADQITGGGLISDIRGRGDKLVATRTEATLEGDVRIRGESEDLGVWSLDAETVLVKGVLDEENTGTSDWERLFASGGFRLEFISQGTLTGDRLDARGSTGVVTAYGKPAEGDEPEVFAVMDRAGLIWTSTWIEYDLNHHLPRSGPGTLDIQNEDAPGVLEYTSLDTLVEPDTLIQAVQLPVYRNEEQELRASWATMWVDRHRWEAFSSGEIDREELAESAKRLREEMSLTASPSTLFESFRGTVFGDVINEVYFEGPIELFNHDVKISRADAFYLDVVDGHGWIAGAHITAQRQVRGMVQPVEVETDWLRVSADGSLRADDARVATCEFEKPHVYVTTKDLRIEPTAKPGLAHWKFQLQDNDMHLYGALKVPLPTLRYSADERGRPMLNSFRFGNSGRFGSIFELAFEGDLLTREGSKDPEQEPASGGGGGGDGTADGGEGSEEGAEAGPAPPPPLPSELPRGFNARYRVRASWLGSRGLLGYGRIRLEPDNLAGHPPQSGSNYWLNFSVGGLADNGDDGGLIKVPQEERSTARVWTHARGRYELGPAEWIEGVFNTQTDPGVQSEFWEGEFIRFNEKDTDLHWRKATTNDYFSATALWRVDDFQTQTQRLPELRWGHTPSTVAPMLNSNLLYLSNTTAAYLDRVEGDTRYQPPAIEASVKRFDTNQRLELPLQTTVAGIKATPFVEGRGTFWSENIQGTDSPSRLALIGGFRLVTTLLKRISMVTTHELIPFLQVRGDLALDEQGGMPYHFDRVEDPVDGKFVDVGLRSRWLKSNGHFLDIQLASGWGYDIGPTDTEGALPLAVFASWRTLFGHVPTSIFHDGRYDLKNGNADFSLTQVAFRPSNYWAVLLDYHFADTITSDPLYNAGSVAARHRWTEKWELEGRQSFSFFEDASLNTAVVVRRYGHDMLVEVEFGQRSGEGGPYFSFGFKPLLGWRGVGNLGDIQF